MSSPNYSEGNIIQVPPQRSVVGDQFTAGNIDYIFSVGRPNVFIPSESYFMVDYTLTYNNRQPMMEDEIAPANDMCSALFTDCSVKLSGQDISNINNFIPQASIVKKRLSHTKAWQESSGLSVHGYDPSFVERQKLVSYNGQDPYSLQNSIGLSTGAGAATLALTAATGGVVGVNVNFTVSLPTHLIIQGIKCEVVTITDALNLVVRFAAGTSLVDVAATQAFTAYKLIVDLANGANRRTVVFKPPLGFFDWAEPVGAGNIQITLNPNSKYNLAAVETKRAMTIGAGANQYTLTINNVIFYAANYKAEPPNNALELELNEINIQSKQLTGNNETFQFTVKPSCVALSWFIQRTAAGTASNIPVGKFVTTNNEELGVSSYQITYASKTVPPTKITQRVLDGATPITNTRENSLVQRYYDTMSACGLIEVGGETLSEWVENGQLVKINFVRSSDFAATQVQFSIDSTGAYTDPTTLYLVEHYETKTVVDTMDGMITSVRRLNIM
jgi:hypothetical protein